MSKRCLSAPKTLKNSLLFVVRIMKLYWITANITEIVTLAQI